MLVCNLVPGPQFWEWAPRGKSSGGGSSRDRWSHPHATKGVIPLSSLDNSSVWLSLLLCQLCIGTGGRTGYCFHWFHCDQYRGGQKNTHCPGKILANGDLDRWRNSRKRPSWGRGPQRRCLYLLMPAGLQLGCVKLIKVQFVAEATC